MEPFHALKHDLCLTIWLNPGTTLTPEQLGMLLSPFKCSLLHCTDTFWDYLILNESQSRRHKEPPPSFNSTAEIMSIAILGQLRKNLAVTHPIINIATFKGTGLFKVLCPFLISYGLHIIVFHNLSITKFNYSLYILECFLQSYLRIDSVFKTGTWEKAVVSTIHLGFECYASIIAARLMKIYVVIFSWFGMNVNKYLSYPAGLI